MANHHNYMMAGTCKKCGTFKDYKDALAWAKGFWLGGGISKDEVCRACDIMDDD